MKMYGILAAAIFAGALLNQTAMAADLMPYSELDSWPNTIQTQQADILQQEQNHQAVSYQQGGSNQALILQNGMANTALIHQNGYANNAQAIQSGALLEASLLQHGYGHEDRKSTRLNSSHVAISYAVFCFKTKR